MDNVFYKSILVQPPVIMGIQLRPFSSFHALKLEQFGNAIATGATIEEADIIQAVEICRDGWNDKCRHLELFHRSALHRAGWVFKVMRHDMDQARADLIEHTKTYTTYPGVWTDKSKKKYSGIPWQFKTPSQLMSHFKLSEQEAWDMPISRAYCYLSNISENCGAEVVSQDALDIREWQNSEVADEIKDLEEYREWRKRKNGSCKK